MACEVESHDYLLHRKNRKARELEVLLQDESPDPPFTFNPVHDLESLWWVWVWVMYFYVDKDGMTLPAEQDQAFRLLFPDYIPATRLQRLTTSLKAHVPMAFRDVFRCAEFVRAELVEAYLEMEISLPPDYSRSLPDLMVHVLDMLQLAVAHAGNTKLYIPPEHCKRKEPEREEGNLSLTHSNKRSKQG